MANAGNCPLCMSLLQAWTNSLLLQADQTTILQFLVQCLMYCEHSQKEVPVVVKHLLLELILPSAAAAAPEHIRREAGHLFTSFCKQPSGAKLAAKIATIFNLQREDLDDWQLLVASLQTMLQNQSSYKAAVHLLMQFEVRSMH
jgi:hypothetical protein